MAFKGRRDLFAPLLWKHFGNKTQSVYRKVSDAETEAAHKWLDFSLSCNYIDQIDYTELDEVYEYIIGKFG